MTFNRCLQLSVDSLHNSIGSRMKSRGSSLTGAQELGQSLKKISLKISASVRYYFWNAETCNPSVVESLQLCPPAGHSSERLQATCKICQ
ncbi:hypothetical protein AVEN_137473-1 [Araneus ventricosus]|uniref:Uncharacterized protein n=1 Tax=Araneus ventricosus TaxID=182803 RepID=A0A4Y2NYB8_ARAVE|nr:hypothetical protein AVEN_137473-1 [Araneus ventricosus]